MSKQKKQKSTVLILKTVNADMTSYNGFKWPEEGVVECSDWNPESVCGGGLHGLLWGCGDGSLLNWGKDAKWIVFEAEESFVVDIVGKVKVPAGEVIYCGTKEGALEILQKARPDLASQMVGAILTGGNYAKMTGGYGANMTGGYGAKMTGGDGANMTGGNYAKMTGGYGANMTGGDGANMTGGDGANMTGGNCAKMTGGDGAKMTGGYGAGFACQYYDSSLNRYLLAVANVGLNGIKANTPYKVNDKGEFVDVKG